MIWQKCSGIRRSYLGGLGMKSFASGPLWFTGMLLSIWGGSMAIVFIGLQTWLLRNAGNAAQPASAIYVAIFNAAIGIGALAGGQIFAVVGLQNMVLLAACVIMCSIAFVSRLKSPGR
ncbi:hypothetical protein [Scandinavium manionii]|uniref:hypothetical protein n=1 Tax=Scandinavium manionii TaxID=2926520 RepID=UPI0035B44C41